MAKMRLFKPSEELLLMLFEYHKANREMVKNLKTPSKKVLARVQSEIAKDFRFALFVFALRIQTLPLRLCSILEKGTLGFAPDMLNKIMQRYLRIGSDASSLAILERFAQEFKVWLKHIGEELKAEKENWPYKRIYMADDGNVIMDLNLRQTTISKRMIN